jgi:hypothetical protein
MCMSVQSVEHGISPVNPCEERMAWITVQEIELEYANGWIQTVILKPGEEFKIPFSGVIIGSRMREIWEAQNAEPGSNR